MSRSEASAQCVLAIELSEFSWNIWEGPCQRRVSNKRNKFLSIAPVVRAFFWPQTASAKSKNPLWPNSTIAVDWIEQLTGSQFCCPYIWQKKLVHWMESPRNNSNITFEMCKCWSYSMTMKDTCQSHSDLLVRSNEPRELPQHLMIWLRAIFSTNRACRWSLPCWQNISVNGQRSHKSTQVGWYNILNKRQLPMTLLRIYDWWSQVLTSQPSSAFSQPTVANFCALIPSILVPSDVVEHDSSWPAIRNQKNITEKKHTISTIQRTAFPSVNRITPAMPVPLAASKWAEVQMCPSPICNDRPKKLVAYLRNVS